MIFMFFIKIQTMTLLTFRVFVTCDQNHQDNICKCMNRFDYMATFLALSWEKSMIIIFKFNSGIYGRNLEKDYTRDTRACRLLICNINVHAKVDRGIGLQAIIKYDNVGKYANKTNSYIFIEMVKEMKDPNPSFSNTIIF